MTDRHITRAARWDPIQITDLDPHPVQQQRGRALPAHTRSVARTTRWANPIRVGAGRDAQAAAVAEYAVWLAGHAELLAAAAELTGFNLACYCPLDQPCHRDVLLDIANPPGNPNPLTAGGRAMGLTLRRPWASLLLVPKALGGKNVENRSWSTDYRGPIAILAGSRIDEAGHEAAAAAGLDADWHTSQTGWLGAAVLVNIHRAHGNCCPPWGYPSHSGAHRYHWVFDAPARLALPTYGRGFLGLRAVPWSVLARRTILKPALSPRASGPTPSVPAPQPPIGERSHR